MTTAIFEKNHATSAKMPPTASASTATGSSQSATATQPARQALAASRVGRPGSAARTASSTAGGPSLASPCPPPRKDWGAKYPISAAASTTSGKGTEKA